MVCCIAAVAVLAAFGKLVARPWAWLRGLDPVATESPMPPPARYDVVTVDAERTVAR